MEKSARISATAERSRESTQKQLRAAVSLEYIQQLSAGIESAEKRIDELATELKGSKVNI